MADSPASEKSLAGFEDVYRNHIELVRRGDMKGVLADMDPAVVPEVFSGIDSPRPPILGTEIRGVRFDGERAEGDCVYTTEAGVIGLRSGWRYDGTTWLADTLSNFEA